MDDSVLVELLTIACFGTSVTPQMLWDAMTPEDIQDLREGRIGLDVFMFLAQKGSCMDACGHGIAFPSF